MRSDALANRRDLVTAASALLAEQGAEMSLRAVAQAAGVGVGTLYRHFRTRRDLLTAVLEHVVERLSAILLRFLEGQGPVAERWTRLAGELADEDLASLLAARDALDARDAPPADRMLAAEQRIAALIDRAVGHAREAGVVAPSVTGDLFITGLIAVSRPAPSPLGDWLVTNRVWILDVYLRGLRP